MNYSGVRPRPPWWRVVLSLGFLASSGVWLALTGGLDIVLRLWFSIGMIWLLSRLLRLVRRQYKSEAMKRARDAALFPGAELVAWPIARVLELREAKRRRQQSTPRPRLSENP
jgi:hypothetical protein